MKAQRHITWARVALGLLLCALALIGRAADPQTALAYGRIDVERETSLTLRMAQDGVGVEGAEFEIFYVGTVSDAARIELTGSFANYGVSVDDLSSEGWRAAAETLAAYAERDNLAALATATTGADGRAVVSGLEVGLYLVRGDAVEWHGTRYTPEPALVMLPQLDDGVWAYDAEAAVKFDALELTRVEVLKTWVDGDAADRPDQVEAQLLCDGEVADTQVLSAANGWRYAWEDLDPAHAWTVVEAEVPEGYTGAVSREGSSFVITNTADEPEKPVTPDEQLPQTGTTWWLVAPLALAGLGAFGYGWHKRRMREA